MNTCEMIAKKDITEGSLLLKEKPFVYTLCSRFRTERCDFCFKKGELSKCSACRYVYYCGKACQKASWPIHKLECQYLNKIAPRTLPDAARILARLIKILETGGGCIKSYYTHENYRTFNDLMSHYANLKNDRGRMEHLSSLYGVLFEYFQGENVPNSSELMSLYGRMCVNSFSICNQEFQSLGSGIYLAASIVNHSCKPSAIVTFEGTTLVMRALETMPTLNWEKILISYIDIMAFKDERQAELQAIYYFLCQCPRCIEPEPTIEMIGMACPNRKCDNCIDSSCIKPNQKCSKCSTTITNEFIGCFDEVMEMTKIHLENMKETIYLDVCKVCLQKQEGLLYKHNVKHVKTLDLAFDSCIEFGKFDEATELGFELIDSFYKYYGRIHPMTGLLHLKLGKLLLYQDRIKEALNNFNKAKSILEITHGITSSLFKEHLVPLYKEAIGIYEQILMK